MFHAYSMISTADRFAVSEFERDGCITTRCVTRFAFILARFFRRAVEWSSKRAGVSSSDGSIHVDAF